MGIREMGVSELEQSTAVPSFGKDNKPQSFIKRREILG
jgi:hypothetical protein